MNHLMFSSNVCIFIAYAWSHHNIEAVAKLPSSKGAIDKVKSPVANMGGESNARNHCRYNYRSPFGANCLACFKHWRLFYDA